MPHTLGGMSVWFRRYRCTIRILIDTMWTRTTFFCISLSIGFFLLLHNNHYCCLQELDQYSNLEQTMGSPRLFSLTWKKKILHRYRHCEPVIHKNSGPRCNNRWQHGKTRHLKKISVVHSDRTNHSYLNPLPSSLLNKWILDLNRTE